MCWLGVRKNRVNGEWKITEAGNGHWVIIYLFSKKVFLLFLCVYFRVFKQHMIFVTRHAWEKNHTITWLIVLKQYQSIKSARFERSDIPKRIFKNTSSKKIQGSVRKHILKKIIFSKTKNYFFFFIFNYFILIIVILYVYICFSLKR